MSVLWYNETPFLPLYNIFDIVVIHLFYFTYCNTKQINEEILKILPKTIIKVVKKPKTR